MDGNGKQGRGKAGGVVKQVTLVLDETLIELLEEEATVFGLSFSELCATALTATLIKSGKVRIVEDDGTDRLTVGRLDG